MEHYKKIYRHTLIIPQILWEEKNNQAKACDRGLSGSLNFLIQDD